MKKILVSAIAFFALFGAASIVFASTSFHFVSTQENVATILFRSDHWNLIPFTDTAWSKRVNEDDLSSTLRERFHPENEDPIGQSDITAAFVFDAKGRRYVPITVRGEDTEEMSAIDLSDASRYPAMWVYFKKGKDGKYSKDAWFKLDPERMPKIRDFTIMKGWNFVWITPDVLNNPLSDFKGSCVVTGLAVWDTRSDRSPGEWKVYDLADSRTLNEKFDNIGLTFALKVAESCQLQTPGEIVPEVPGLPDNANSTSVPATSCMDSDGGQDYFIKGTTKGVNAQGEGFAHTDYCVSAGQQGTYGAYLQTGQQAVMEYACNNNAKTVYDDLHVCEKGCQDGACMK